MIKFNELFGCNQNNTIVKTPTTKISVPWVDKYRPRKLSEIVYQDDAIKMLKSVLETGNLPHLLFHGHAGTGKTSAILAIAMELFGPKKFRERVTELNASDERGINIVRNKIVNLAKTAVSGNDPKYICPPFKIIILDEADAMTNEAQSALRKTMEDHSGITRFCFICNYINQIIDPIASRCVKFRFKPIDEIHMNAKLAMIIKNEKMNVTKNAISTISKISCGDMRKAIMLLQNLNYLGKEIHSNDVFNIANMLSYKKLSKIINVCTVNNDCEILRIVTDNIIKNGYPLNMVLEQLTESIINNNNLTESMKAQICFHISITEKRLIDGADEFLQLLSIFSCIRSVSKNIDVNNA